MIKLTKILNEIKVGNNRKLSLPIVKQSLNSYFINNDFEDGEEIAKEISKCSTREELVIVLRKWWYDKEIVDILLSILIEF